MTQDKKHAIDDGGPAFPVERDLPGLRGMSLRDYFAAKVVAGTGEAALWDEKFVRRLAQNAYAVADAMLEERKR